MRKHNRYKALTDFVKFVWEIKTRNDDINLLDEALTMLNAISTDNVDYDWAHLPKNLPPLHASLIPYFGTNAVPSSDAVPLTLNLLPPSPTSTDSSGPRTSTTPPVFPNGSVKNSKDAAAKPPVLSK